MRPQVCGFVLGQTEAEVVWKAALIPANVLVQDV